MSHRKQWVNAVGALIALTAVFFLTLSHREVAPPKVPSESNPVPYVVQKLANLVPKDSMTSKPVVEPTIYEQLPELTYLFALSSDGHTLSPRPSYSRRNLALRRIQAEPLTDGLLEELHGFLLNSTGLDKNGRSDLVEASIKNDLIEWLEDQRPPIESLTSTLVALSEDPAQPDVIRDYAIQHMGSWAELLNESTVPWQSGALVELTEQLWVATDLKEHSFAGTALLSLRRLKGELSARIQQRAKEILENSEYSSLSRATALQLFADRILKAHFLTAASCLVQNPHLN